MRILLTGGAGFIGSHVADLLVGIADTRLVVFDKMTYAADFRNLTTALAQRAKLFIGDICDYEACLAAARNVDLVIHVAAESHVDNSFGSSLQFTHTNVLGTHMLMEACRVNRVPRIIHVSTDEVYGDIVSGSFDEQAPLRPTNPYSASKAAAEMVINGYMSSFKLPVIIARGNNIYGTRQYPEKIIPKFCMQLLRGQRLTIHGNGTNVRSYLAVQDFAEALVKLIHHGEAGQIYNIGTNEEFSNLWIARMLCDHFSVAFDDHVEFMPDRPFNDLRYSITCDKIKTLGWQPAHHLVDELGGIVAWYCDNAHRYEDVNFGSEAEPRGHAYPVVAKG